MASEPVPDMDANIPGLAARGRPAEHRASPARLVLADRLASLGLVAAGVAHDVATPLTFLLSNLEFAQEALAALPPQGDGFHPLLARARTALDDAEEGARLVRVLVGDLRSLSRDDGAHRPVDVRTVLDSALHLVRPTILARARLVEACAPVPPVVGSASRLGQVFMNLLLNAAQALPAERTEGSEIRVATRVDGDGQVVVEIRDTGSGIEASVLARIFDVFFTTKPEGVGTGLGLAVSRQIVEEAGGRIEVESTAGAGSTFSVILPTALGEGS
jgi:signal transduction histidine kinase